MLLYKKIALVYWLSGAYKQAVSQTSSQEPLLAGIFNGFSTFLEEKSLIIPE